MPPQTVTAVKVSAGTPSPTSGTVGYDVTFTNVSVTIRGPEAIPINNLTFTVYNNANNATVSYVIFNITGHEISDPDGRFAITLVTDISSVYQSSGSYYGYDERTNWNGTGYPFSYGYGYGSGTAQKIVANFTIVYDTDTVGTFFAKLSVNSSKHTYVSVASSTFTVSSSGGGGTPGDDDDDVVDDVTDDDVVPDDDDDTGAKVVTIPESELADIKSDYGVNLTEPFQANDTDGDGNADELYDPNDVLTQVHEVITINGNATILISVDEDDIPEFFWDTVANTITPITPQNAQIQGDEVINQDEGKITITISVEKVESQWICIDIEDKYPNYIVMIKTSDGRVIPNDMIWRKDGKIYVLDDPATEYLVIYSYTPSPTPPAGDTTPTEKKGDMPWLLIIVFVTVVIFLSVVYLFKTGYLYIEYEEQPKEFEKVEEFEKIDVKADKKTTTPKKGSSSSKKKKK